MQRQWNKIISVGPVLSYPCLNVKVCVIWFRRLVSLLYLWWTSLHSGPQNLCDEWFTHTNECVKDVDIASDWCPFAELHIWLSSERYFSTWQSRCECLCFLTLKDTTVLSLFLQYTLPSPNLSVYISLSGWGFRAVLDAISCICAAGQNDFLMDFQASS